MGCSWEKDSWETTGWIKKCVPRRNNEVCRKNGLPGLCVDKYCVPISGEKIKMFFLRLEGLALYGLAIL